MRGTVADEVLCCCLLYFDVCRACAEHVLLHAQQEGETQTYYAQGFPVGLIDTNTKKYYVNNHVHMVVDYHPMEVIEVRKSKEPYRERLLILAKDMLTVGVCCRPSRCFIFTSA